MTRVVGLGGPVLHAVLVGQVLVLLQHLEDVLVRGVRRRGQRLHLLGHGPQQHTALPLGRLALALDRAAENLAPVDKETYGNPVTRVRCFKVPLLQFFL